MIADATGNANGTLGTTGAAEASDPTWSAAVCAMVGMDELTASAFTLALDGAGGTLQVFFPRPVPPTPMQVLDTQGRIVHSSTAQGTTAVVDLTRLAAGAYVVQVGHGPGMRFVKP